MSEFVTQLEIVRGETKAIVEKLVNTLIVGKCVKKIQYVFHRSEQLSRAACEAYVYYTTPSAPVITINSTVLSHTSVEIYGTLTTNSVALRLLQQGIVLNLTGNPTIEDQIKYINPPAYGNYTKTIVNIRAGRTNYLRSYCLTCLGYTYSDVVEVFTVDPILDTYGIGILDTYGEYILDTY